MAEIRLPEEHIDPPKEVVYSSGDFGPTTIGDIPEFAQVFKSLYDMLNEAKGLPLPGMSDIDAELLPVGKGEAYEPTGESRPDVPTTQRRNMAFLFGLAEQYGNGSELYNVTLRDRKTQEARGEPYYAATLNNPNGTLRAVVADTATEDNAVYVWRGDLPADLQPTTPWVEVFTGDKGNARANQAVPVKHIGDYEDRVLKLVNMDPLEYVDFVTSKTRPRL